MLRELRIRDFAIIDRLSVTFVPGLNVLTGETGAGKSIVVDALGLALGDRAQSDFVRSGRSETVVEAFFDDDARETLGPFGIPADDGLILRRVVSAAGKSRAFINDSPVSVQTLADIGRAFVDIHGQHEHQSLLSPMRQLGLVDGFGRLHPERERFARAYQELLAARSEAAELGRSVREREQRADFLRFQIQEIDAASLKEGEKEEIEAERAILANLSKLKGLTDTAYTTLYSADGAVAEGVASVLSAVRDLARIDPTAAETLDSLESAKNLIDDAAAALRALRDRYELDPGRLDAAEERLDLLKKLERKYGEGIDGILAFRRKAGEELDSLTGSDERLQQLEKTAAEKEAAVNSLARQLTAARKKAAKAIEAAVGPALRELAMAKARFTIEFRQNELSAGGADAAEFLFSANEGEPLKPLAKIASGGELSRVMLALKESLAEADRIPVLIFDEVDAGIGGKTAEHVAQRLKSLSLRHQVLCITHLPQIAARADHHSVIEKRQEGPGVCVTVRNVSDQDREEEIARMLSGTITDISMKHARQLLGSPGQR